MTPECHRLAKRLERARLLRRWSEVLAVAQQLTHLSGQQDGETIAGLKKPSAPGNIAKRSLGASDRHGMPKQSLGTRARESGGRESDFDVSDSPAILPLRRHNRTQTATWLQKWWSLAFPGGARKGEGMANAQEAKRFLLWVDAVGGFLVCTADEVVIGQPVPGSEVDIPIRGDLSRRHAVIHRDGESYLLEPVREVKINGIPAERPTSLRNGDGLKLGDCVELRFRRPHPLSLSARLEPISYHRTQPATDGVLLMAESCILGPAPTSHIVCNDWPHDVVIYRQGDSLSCRSPKAFKVDGASCHGRAPLTERSQVAGERFSFSIEPA